jgi:mRNA interferase RelE/StbE
VTDTPWRVEVEQRAKKDLTRLDAPVRRRVVKAIRALAEDPRGGTLRQLSGREGYRLRVGDWRVLVALKDETRTIQVLRVLPRGRAYDR